MSIVVQKFGGTSVENNEKLLNVCKHIIREYKNQHKVVVVVSAQRKNNRWINKRGIRIKRKS